MSTTDVLLVDDNRSDVVLLQEAFAQAGLRYRLHFAKDGVVAMDFLLRRGAYASAPRPELIILDLNMPRKDGREVLAEISRYPELRRIPLVVLTSSTTDRDIIDVFGLPEDSYLVKPTLFDDYIKVAKFIEVFRLSEGAHGSAPCE